MCREGTPYAKVEEFAREGIGCQINKDDYWAIILNNTMK